MASEVKLPSWMDEEIPAESMVTVRRIIADALDAARNEGRGEIDKAFDLIEKLIEHPQQLDAVIHAAEFLNKHVPKMKGG